MPHQSHSSHSPQHNSPRLVCVGYGNMARAMLSGIIESKLFIEYEILIIGRDLQKAQSLCDDLMHANSTGKNPASKNSTNEKLTNENPTHALLQAICLDSHTPLDIEGCEVLLCVKPHALGVFTYTGKAHIVYSVMAGVRVDTIARAMSAQSFVRIMPNVGALYGKSASCVYIHTASDTDSVDMCDIQSAVRRLVESFGNCVIVDNESLIDASIATSGSAPAFLAVVAQSLIDSGIYHGLNYAQSAELVAQTFSGFAALLEHKTPDEIKISITSPAGTTARGLAALERNGVRGAFIEAGVESVKRAKELGDS